MDTVVTAVVNGRGQISIDSIANVDLTSAGVPPKVELDTSELLSTPSGTRQPRTDNGDIVGWTGSTDLRPVVLTHGSRQDHVDVRGDSLVSDVTTDQNPNGFHAT